MQQTVLITGAAGGIGRELAMFFMREGWRVEAVDIADFPADMHGQPLIGLHKTDVTDETAMERIASAAAAGGGLRAAIINAAVTDLDHSAVVDMPFTTGARVCGSMPKAHLSRRGQRHAPWAMAATSYS